MASHSLKLDALAADSKNSPLDTSVKMPIKVTQEQCGNTYSFVCCVSYCSFYYKCSSLLRIFTMCSFISCRVLCTKLSIWVTFPLTRLTVPFILWSTIKLDLLLTLVIQGQSSYVSSCRSKGRHFFKTFSSLISVFENEDWALKIRKVK